MRTWLTDGLWGMGLALLFLVAMCFATGHGAFIYVDF